MIGDYGAYLEFAFHESLVHFTIKKGQEWRLDTKYIADRNLKPKYVWLEYGSVKVYLQLDRVKYADYKPNYFYISIHEFDDATV